MNATTRLLSCTLALGLATTLTADTTTNTAVVYCKARIAAPSWATGDEVLSVTLPPTPGMTDPWGNLITAWNIGDIAAGGVADTWHDGGPAFFQVRNTGNVEAYVYVVAVSKDEINNSPDNYPYTLSYLFGQSPGSPIEVHKILPVRPTVRVNYDNAYSDRTYHLALTTDVTAVAPVWRSLDHATLLGGGEWTTDYVPDPCQCSAYLGTLPPGEYQPFDLKFWAPPDPGEWDGVNVFVFRVEASSFPRWEHAR